MPKYGYMYLSCPLQHDYMDRVKRIWYLSPMRAAKVQASLRIHAVSPEPPLLAHTSSESRGTFRQKARSLAPLNGWACAVEICHDGMLEDTNSLDGAHMFLQFVSASWKSEGTTWDFQYNNDPKFSDRQVWSNSIDPDQTAPRSSLLLEEQSDQGLHCLPFRLLRLDA